MLYLFIDKNQVKLLSLKKSIIGQYEACSFSKNYQSDLLQNGSITNVDFVASAVKEGLQSLSNDSKERDTLLILPQESYFFLRIGIPADIAPSAIESFILDKVKADLNLNLEEMNYDFYVEEGTTEKIIHFFAVKNDVIKGYREALHLIDLKLNLILPETAAYFKLFQKTLRKDKKENIFFVSYGKNSLTGFLYDSFGQISGEKWSATVIDPKLVEDTLKEKAEQYEKSGKKLNRLILSGEQSETIRQDTFTKAIGVWTNPLKRILPEFYGEYLKLILNSTDKPFSFLPYEVCVGAFIFHEQNKNFSLLNHSGGIKNKFALPKIDLPLKEIIFFLISFIISFILLIGFSKLKLNIKFPSLSSKTQVNPVTKTRNIITPTLNPTPAINRADVKIKVLNGSGTPGRASALKDILKNKGYQEILTGNADSFNFNQSELQIKESKASVSTMLKSDLKENITSFKELILSDKEAADVLIIIGKDFK